MNHDEKHVLSVILSTWPAHRMKEMKMATDKKTTAERLGVLVQQAAHDHLLKHGIVVDEPENYAGLVEIWRSGVRTVAAPAETDRQGTWADARIRVPYMPRFVQLEARYRGRVERILHDLGDAFESAGFTPAQVHKGSCDDYNLEEGHFWWFVGAAVPGDNSWGVSCQVAIEADEPHSDDERVRFTLYLTAEEEDHTFFKAVSGWASSQDDAQVEKIFGVIESASKIAAHAATDSYAYSNTDDDVNACVEKWNVFFSRPLEERMREYASLAARTT